MNSYQSLSLLQSLLNLPPNQRKNIPIDTGTVERVAPATLREYALQYFRYVEIISVIQSTPLTAAKVQTSVCVFSITQTAR